MAKSKKYYTLAEVNKMIPQLEEAFRRILQMHVQIQLLCQRLDAAGYLPEGEEIEIDPKGAAPEIIHDLASVKLLIIEINEQLKKINEMGCIIKDVEIGLVDWYAKDEEGKEVFLCWQLGEKSVNYWHEVDAGFKERKPIAELQH